MSALANALGRFGAPVTYLGNLGVPTLDPIFKEFSLVPKLLLGNAGVRESPASSGVVGQEDLLEQERSQVGASERGKLPSNHHSCC